MSSLARLLFDFYLSELARHTVHAEPHDVLEIHAARGWERAWSEHETKLRGVYVPGFAGEAGKKTRASDGCSS